MSETTLATTTGGQMPAMTFSPQQVDLIKRTVCKGATDDELALFLYTAKRLGLDPLARQIHAVKRWDGSQQREVMAIQVAIDGMRLLAHRTGQYIGSDDPVYTPDTGEHPDKASVTVHKLLPNGITASITASARWTEYVSRKKDGTLGPPWARMPYLMLGKCAESLALRKAFPAELSGVYSEEEVQVIGRPVEVKPAMQAPQRKSQASAEAVAVGDWREMTAKYAGKCSLCETAIPLGEKQLYSPSVKKVRCLTCKPGSVSDQVAAVMTPAENADVRVE